jgi:hypothetical protein
MVREHGEEWWQMRCRSVDSHDRPLMDSRESSLEDSRSRLDSRDLSLRDSYICMDSQKRPLKSSDSCMGSHDHAFRDSLSSMDSHDHVLLDSQNRSLSDSHNQSVRNRTATSGPLYREAFVEGKASQAVAVGENDMLGKRHNTISSSHRAQAAQAQVVSSAHDRAGGNSMRYARTDLHGSGTLGQAAVSEDVHVGCPGYESQKGSSGSDWGPPMIVSAIERVQSGLIGETLSSMGITSLYVTLVFGLGRFLRMGLTNIRMRIPYQDLPCVDRLITLCNYIAVAREEGELLLEEQLFYSLLNIYRSPAVLFEVTKKDD